MRQVIFASGAKRNFPHSSFFVFVFSWVADVFTISRRGRLTWQYGKRGGASSMSIAFESTSMSCPASVSEWMVKNDFWLIRHSGFRVFLDLCIDAHSWGFVRTDRVFNFFSPMQTNITYVIPRSLKHNDQRSSKNEWQVWFKLRYLFHAFTATVMSKLTTQALVTNACNKASKAKGA